MFLTSIEPTTIWLSILIVVLWVGGGRAMGLFLAQMGVVSRAEKTTVYLFWPAILVASRFMERHRRATDGVVLIVYGPEGCGKTTNAERIRDFFGVQSYVDEWGPDQPKWPGAVHLTNIPMPGAINYEQVMQAIEYEGARGL